MKKTTMHNLIPLISLLLVASIFLSNPTSAVALPVGEDLEPNNFISEASDIWPGYHSGNNQSDVDWYKIWANHSEILEIMLVYNTSEGILNLELFDENETSLVNASGDYLSWNNFNSDQYLYFRISGPDLEQWYDLDIYLYYDSYEDNDYYWDPIFLVLDFDEMNLVSSDDDFYEFYLMPGDFVDIHIWSNSWINLTLAQIDPDTGAWMQWDSTTDDGMLYLYIESTMADNFTIGIFGDNIGENYHLNIDLNSVMVDDWAEPNNARSESYNLSGSGYYSGLMNNDDDWFLLGPINNGETLRVELHYMNLSMDWLSLELFDTAGFYHGFSTWEEPWGEVLEWTAGGFYTDVFLKVSGYGGVPYTLNINLFNSGADDWMEPNDNLGQAWDLPFGWTNGLLQFDEDWFRIWMEPNDDLHVDLNYDYPSTTLNLTLFDEYGTELAWNELVQSLDWINNAAYGQYVFLRVIGESEGDWYDLNVLMNGQGIGDDWAEENDDYQNYYYLGTGYFDNLYNHDDDYFAIDLQAGDILKVWVHSLAAYWLRLEWVAESDGHIILSDETWSDGGLFLEIHADFDGKYILAVKGENMGEWYDIQMEIDRDASSTVEPTDDPTGTDDPSDPDNPFGDFDLENIPGYPIEMVGGIMLLAIMALIIPLKKKFHR